MGTTASLSFNLGLPAVPETENKAIFLELAKLYNAVNIIAQTLDTYTSSGGATAAITVVLTDLQVQLDSIANITALVYQMDQKLTTGTATGAAATDLATVIVLANNLRTIVQSSGIGV